MRQDILAYWSFLPKNTLLSLATVAVNHTDTCCSEVLWWHYEKW